ncbi:MAG: TIGR02253 family HAD-type hydrolase [Promethearchaeota archaeon]
MGQKIKVVGFDLDDCLFDSTGLSARARIMGIKAMIDLGLNISLSKANTIMDEIVSDYGSNFPKHYNYLIKRLNNFEEGVNVPPGEQYKYISAAVIAYHQAKIDNIRLYDDVEECLKKLRKMKIKTAIITDGIPIKQYEKINRLGLTDLIDLVVISDQLGIRKPNPKLFDYCLKKFGVKGEEVIYVGDRIEKDIIPALLNNMISVYIHRGGKWDTRTTGMRIPDEIQPDYEISNLNELFPIIEELNEK